MVVASVIRLVSLGLCHVTKVLLSIDLFVFLIVMYFNITRHEDSLF